MAERLYIQNRKARERRKRQFYLAGKGILVLLGCAAFLFLLGRCVAEIATPKEEGNEEYVPLQEAGNLVWLLADTAASLPEGEESALEEKPDPDAVLGFLKKMDASEGDGCLTYGQAKELLSFLPEPGGHSLDFKRKNEKVKLSDWFLWFDGVRPVYDRTGRIQDVSVTVLGVGGFVKRNDGTTLPEQRLVTTEAEWEIYATRFAQTEMTGRTLSAVSRDEGLYAIRRQEEPGFVLPNAWVLQAGQEGLTYFWNDYEIHVPAFIHTGEENGEEQTPVLETKKDAVADLSFVNGQIVAAVYKENKISGRLLKIADGGAEVEGHGFFPFSEQLKIYQLYGRMRRLYTGDLRIGYAFTDFVVEGGEIAAALVPKEEKMEYIRVLVKTSDYGGAYHDFLTLQADCDCSVYAGLQKDEPVAKLRAGETVTISKDSSLFGAGDRILVEPDILTGHIRLLNVSRAQESPAYRGSFELVKSRDGIVAVNELLLEEYLYAVVPSEMPASYPLEALKGQAICARTYAYAKMCHAGLPAYGAHVDDSAGFQVYQNIAENPETTKAVRETKGETLFFGEELAEVYYYSTSCGYGADASVWRNGNDAAYPYLVSQKIGEGDHFFEEQEPWFRWRYEVASLQEDVINSAVQKRYEANADGVLTRQPDGSFAAQKPPETGRIREISVALYGAGGVAEQLLIEGEQATLLVKTEHNIRYVLCDGTAQVLRQDGSGAQAPSMVPSAFFTMETSKADGYVVGYTLSGGGFGHGVGMSQNGARNMALAGWTSGDILAFFFKGCAIGTTY